MLLQPDSTDDPIDENRSIGDLIPSNDTNLLKQAIDRERWEVINAQMKIFCRGSQPVDIMPSHQQVFWLYYGLGLTQAEIARVFNSNFNKCGNPGSVSRLLRGGRDRLSEQIYTALNHQMPIVTDEIEASMIELIELYFDSVVTYYVVSVAGRLGLEIHAKISVSRRIELGIILADWFQEKNMVQVPSEIIEAAISRIIDNYFS